MLWIGMTVIVQIIILAPLVHIAGIFEFFFGYLIELFLLQMYIVPLVDHYKNTDDERFKKYAADGGRCIFQIDLG